MLSIERATDMRLVREMFEEYESLGFVDIAPYRYNELDLECGARGAALRGRTHSGGMAAALHIP